MIARLLLQPLAPVAVGELLVLVALLGVATGWRELVTVPGLRAAAATERANAELRAAEVARLAVERDTLRTGIDEQNAAVSALAAGCTRASEAADAAARRVIAIRPAVKPAADAAALNAWLAAEVAP